MPDWLIAGIFVVFFIILPVDFGISLFLDIRDKQKEKGEGR
jgi:hypothetical protein